MAKQMIRVGITACRSVFRKGLRGLVAEAGPFQVAWAAPDEETTRALLATTAVDVLIADPFALVSSLSDFVRDLRGQFPGTRVVLFAEAAEEDQIRAAFRAGALGVLSPDCEPEELVLAVERVLGGKKYLCPAAMDLVLESFLRHCAPVARDALTPREEQVLELVVKGMSNDEISGALGIAVNTVLKHRSQIMRKTGHHSSATLIAHALQQPRKGKGAASSLVALTLAHSAEKSS